MRLFKVDFDPIYEWGDDKEEKLASRVKERRSRLDRVELGLAETDDDDIRSLRDVVVTADQLLTLQTLGEVLKIKQEIKISDDLETALAKFSDVAERMMALPESERVFNERVEVHMPGYTLATYNETMLLENACTDELQNCLDTGWRIVAACPQPDNRRPDYILGRYNPKRDSYEHRYGALRSNP